MVTGLSISGVCERDIDLLLLEEFLSSTDFLNWFVAHTARTEGTVQLVEVRRSVTQSNGESDLELCIDTEAGVRMLLLIENKVNAGLQPQQAERYRARAESHRLQSQCQETCTVLVAPARYFGSDSDLKGFDVRLRYEEVREWFVASESLGPRSTYKAALLTAAIQKGQLGYQVIKNDFVSDFWLRYWETAREIAPDLLMDRPTGKPSGATFIVFKPNGLPKGVEVWHKLSHGNVDLQFSGFGERLDELEDAFEYMLDPDMTVVKANKSGAIRIEVPEINVAHPFEPQRKAVEIGLLAAHRLLNSFLPFKKYLPKAK